MEKVEQFRKFMQKHDLKAFIVPTSDDHKSEYIADYWKCREWLSGFSGSAGTAVITINNASVWTDSRYFIQAENELLPPFKLHKLKTRGPEYIDWLKTELPASSKIGIDPQLFSNAELENIKTNFEENNLDLVLCDDPFDEIWLSRPILPQKTVFAHNEKYCGKKRGEKIEALQQHLSNNKTDYLIVSALDDIAWLLNLRGSDINYNPVFYSYFIVDINKSYIFIDNKKLNNDIKEIFKASNTEIRGYSEIFDFVSKIPNESCVEIDNNSINYKLFSCISKGASIKKESSLIATLKTIKSVEELKHYKNAQIRDGIAVCKFLYWLEQNINSTTITEISAADKLEEFRTQGNNYVGLSFGTISAYGANAALPHYAPNKEKPTVLKAKSLYLVDSGAQYYDGTTDITRTISLGKPSKEEITDFTLVLKGHIKVATTVFPEGTTGKQIDTLARIAMWRYGKDFGHGTGHGIGYFLNVHEGPQGFSQAKFGASQTILKPGMLTTNEPGMYIEDKYGIRTENVLACVHDTKTEFGNFLKFETVTYCPIDSELIDTSMLETEEVEWINNYHQTVFDLLAPFCDKDLTEWLKTKTSPLK